MEFDDIDKAKEAKDSFEMAEAQIGEIDSWQHKAGLDQTIRILFPATPNPGGHHAFEVTVKSPAIVNAASEYFIEIRNQAEAELKKLGVEVEP